MTKLLWKDDSTERQSQETLTAKTFFLNFYKTFILEFHDCKTEFHRENKKIDLNNNVQNLGSGPTKHWFFTNISS